MAKKSIIRATPVIAEVDYGHGRAYSVIDQRLDILQNMSLDICASLNRVRAKQFHTFTTADVEALGQLLPRTLIPPSSIR